MCAISPMHVFIIKVLQTAGLQSTIISTGEQVASTVSSTVLHAGLSSEGIVIHAMFNYARTCLIMEWLHYFMYTAATSLAGTALSTQGLSTLQYPPLSRSGKSML